MVRADGRELFRENQQGRNPAGTARSAGTDRARLGIDEEGRSRRPRRPRNSRYGMAAGAAAESGLTASLDDLSATSGGQVVMLRYRYRVFEMLFREGVRRRP